MSNAVAEYEKLVQSLCAQPGVAAGQMFGKPCLKVGGKAFAAQHKEAVVFKLTGTEHARAVALPGAALWDPSGKGRPMKEWVALPARCNESFAALAAAAQLYVAGAA